MTPRVLCSFVHEGIGHLPCTRHYFSHWEYSSENTVPVPGRSHPGGQPTGPGSYLHLPGGEKGDSTRCTQLLTCTAQFKSFSAVRARCPLRVVLGLAAIQASFEPCKLRVSSTPLRTDRTRISKAVFSTRLTLPEYTLTPWCCAKLISTFLSGKKTPMYAGVSLLQSHCLPLNSPGGRRLPGWLTRAGLSFSSHNTNLTEVLTLRQALSAWQGLSPTHYLRQVS